MAMPPQERGELIERASDVNQKHSEQVWTFQNSIDESTTRILCAIITVSNKICTAHV